MSASSEKNKALVLEAFDTLFNKRDYQAALAFWSPDYIQHSAHIVPGRSGLFDLVRSAPPTLRHEPGLVLAEGDLVFLHGRFSGRGDQPNWLAEHWDVLQDEATRATSKSGLPMFGDAFLA